MTLRRLRWLFVPLVAGAALAVLVLPPRALPDRGTFVGAVLGFGGGPWRRDVQEEHRWSVERARDRLREQIAARAHGASDILAAGSPRALRSSAEPIVIVRDTDVPETAARAWLQAAEGELARAPRTGTRGAPVIVALHARSPVEIGGWMTSETMVDRFQFESGATRACIVDVVFRKVAARGTGRFDVPQRHGRGILGRCALYARFGFPGSEVGRWAGLAARWSGRWAWWYSDQGMFVERRPTLDTLRFRLEYGEVPWAELGCFRGQDVYCSSLVGLTSVPGVGRGGAFYYYFFGWQSLSTPDRLLADLILERGPERFATFWESALPPDSALHLVYGVPAGALVRQAFSRRFVPEPTAQPSVGGLLVATGWVVALGVLAMGLAWRREMDL
jgi:hypothetical protein